MSNKAFLDNGLDSQKQAGWTFLFADGTWAWNMGSGNRRIAYERTNGRRMPLNDGRWHQLVMTHDATAGLVFLCYDGINRAIFNIRDSGRFEFANESPLTLGWTQTAPSFGESLPDSILHGAADLQELVDEFNVLGLKYVRDDELELLVNHPEQLVVKRRSEKEKQNEFGAPALEPGFDSKVQQRLKALSSRLMNSPYTVHQDSPYREVALIFGIYSLRDGKIFVNEDSARKLARREVLSPPDIELDELKIWERAISSQEVLEAYSIHFDPAGIPLAKQVIELTAATWNIFHGGLHMNMEGDGWDSRSAIAELIRRENIDVVMMQETYSSGDYIAVELGFTYATTIDWDNMHQGENLSVLSRFPIREVVVPPKSTFMNIAARVAISETQDVWVMSNWYGMRNFEDVYGFHRERFADSEKPSRVHPSEQAPNRPDLFPGKRPEEYFNRSHFDLAAPFSLRSLLDQVQVSAGLFVAPAMMPDWSGNAPQTESVRIAAASNESVIK